ncbi:MAG TPA: hypothetical protein VFB69_03215 [Candidatus Dormibacteraeota bacterium]|nr:hypothetical protein [Candidatus Dormibacteraeota bacterium]
MVRTLAVAALLLLAAAACGDTHLHTTAAKVAIPTGKAASFDDVEIDQTTETVYAADRPNTGVDVFDVSGAQPRFVKTIKLPAEPNGLAIDRTRHRVYAGTAAGAIEVIDAANGTLLPDIKTAAKEVDLLDYAAGPGLLFASTADAGLVLTVDPAAGKVVATANVGKPVEQPRYNAADGKVYVTVPELDSLAVIEPKTGTVTKTRKVASCIPVGLAINASTDTAVIACHKSVAAFDLRTGETTDLGRRAAGGDIVQYYPSVDRFFVIAQHSAVPSVVAMFGGDPVAYVGSVTLDGGGRTAVYDQRSDSVYTTDARTGTAGLTGFHMDGSKPVPGWQGAALAAIPIGLLVLLIGPIWWFAARHADPIHRRSPAPRAAGPVQAD